MLEKLLYIVAPGSRQCLTERTAGEIHSHNDASLPREDIRNTHIECCRSVCRWEGGSEDIEGVKDK